MSYEFYLICDKWKLELSLCLIIALWVFLVQFLIPTQCMLLNIPERSKSRKNLMTSSIKPLNVKSNYFEGEIFVTKCMTKAGLLRGEWVASYLVTEIILCSKSGAHFNLKNSSNQDLELMLLVTYLHIAPSVSIRTDERIYAKKVSGKFVSDIKVLAAVPSISQPKRVYHELHETWIN